MASSREFSGLQLSPVNLGSFRGIANMIAYVGFWSTDYEADTIE